MKAFVFNAAANKLAFEDVADPELSGDCAEVLVKVEACGVCRTDLHVVDGELAEPKVPVIPGHQVVGRVVAVHGAASAVAKSHLQLGDRVGLAWLASTCGTCDYCLRGQENLCDKPLFNGYTKDGGFAELVAARADFCFKLGEDADPVSFCPLMCAGLIGWRSYKFAREALPPGGRLGIYGFGSAAHILAQVAKADGYKVSAFVRQGDEQARAFALKEGVDFAGFSDELPPQLLDAAIIFAPAGALVPAALKATNKGAMVVLGGIHMSDIPSFPYEIIWGERSLKSVANLTREDGQEFFEMIARGLIKISTRVEARPLAQAKEALDDLRAGKVQGSLALIP
jgi:alcohol dehydrogenase, propanol-preferring